MASGCAVCAATNQCSFAFHNGPGQYCGDFFDYSTLTTKPCCCPLLQVGTPSTCNMTPRQCKCHIYDTSYNPRYNHGAHVHSTHFHYSRSPSPVTPLIMMLLILGCCFICCCRRKPEHNHHYTNHDSIPIATAVNEGASCPPAENPAFTTSYGSTTHHHHHGNGNALSSGLGGFAIGTLVGDLIGRNAADRGDHYHLNNFGDGGYDIIGDSGGSDGYDIQGDSGGGYDIQGDS